MKIHIKQLTAGALAALFLVGVWGCNKAKQTGGTEPEGTGITGERLMLPESTSAGTSVFSLPGTSATTTKKPPATKKNINTKGNKITDDPKYIGNLNDRKDEDPQYRPRPNPGGNEKPADTISTTKPTTTKPATKPSSGGSTTKPAAGTTTQPNAKPQNGWYTAGGKTYFYSGGKPVTGWQSMNGLRYYFDAGGALSSKVGLDVSEWNESIDWNKVKAAGVDFVMIRVGFRGYGKEGNIRLDASFKKHLQGASQAGLDCGVYFFTQAITPEEAREEARFVLAAIEGFTLTYPIAFDIEESGAPNGSGRTDKAKLNNTQRTDICIAFADTIKKAGYFPSIYASYHWLQNKLQASRLSSYDIWLAHYTSSLQTSYPGTYQMWQYTSTGKVSGVGGNVDCNIGLRDYADYLRKNGWNHLR